MISSPKHRWLKDIRRLQRSKDAEGRLLLEGPHLVAEALDAGLELEATLATPEFLASGDVDARAVLERLRRPPLEVDPALLEELADADTPRGLVAIGRKTPGRLADIPVVGGGLYVFADGIQDPGNLGALARVAEASGAVALFAAPGCSRLEHPRALRASAGSLLRLPAVDQANVESVDGRLSDARWLALAPRGGVDLYDRASTDWFSDQAGDHTSAAPLVLAVGGEGPGLGEAVRNRTDTEITIPMFGPVESLNATVAAAVALFELARRRRPEGAQS